MMKNGKFQPKTSISKRWTQAFIALILLVCLLPTSSGSAQTNESSLEITEINIRNFPEISLNIRGHHLNENLSGQLSDIEIIEDGTSITPDSLEYHYQGVHFAVAINPDSSFMERGPDGTQYHLAISQALQSVGPEPENALTNRYSFFSNPEINLVETDDYASWSKLLTGIETIDTNQSASLASLELAISALETSVLPLDTVLVYVTPYLDFRLLPEFYELIGRAGELGVETHVWMAMTRRVLGSSYETELLEAITAAGGTLNPLTGTELVPNPRQYMQGKGQAYTINYQSALRTAGDYDVSLRAKFANSPTLQSPATTLALDLQPTKLTFLNLPETLQVTFNNDGSFQPNQLPIEALIEFPDGYPRSILNSTLFVNGGRLLSNTQSPYGNFVIDLEPYLEDTEIELELRLQDDFGLQGRSEVRTVTLDVFKPESLTQAVWYSSPWLWIGLVGALALLAFLIFRKPKLKNEAVENVKEEEKIQGEDKAERPEKKSFFDIFRGKGAKKPNGKNVNEARENNPEKAYIPKAVVQAIKKFGSLTRLDPDQTPSAEKPHLLTEEITLIGRDPSVANLVLDDPSIEALHAEIHFYPDGRIRLTDFNSTSGSYVNFKAVGAQGANLQHADLIHFGTLLFRFNSASRTQDRVDSIQQTVESSTKNRTKNSEILILISFFPVSCYLFPAPGSPIFPLHKLTKWLIIGISQQ